MANKRVVSGLSFLDLLGILFIGLKLAGVINWSWWLVTLPIWGPFALIVVILVGAVIFGALVGIISALIDYANR